MVGLFAAACAQAKAPPSFGGSDGSSRQRPDGGSLPPDGSSFPADAAGGSTDGLAPTDAPAPPTDAPVTQGPCGAAPVIPIVLPYDITMSTSGGADFFHVVGAASDPSTFCIDGDGTGSPDRVFRFTLATPTNIRITTGNPGTSFPVVLYVRSGDCRSYEGCDMQPRVSDPPALLVGNAVPAGTYFLVVDGFNASGTFHLTVTTF